MDDNAIVHGFQPECSVFQNVSRCFKCSFNANKVKVAQQSVNKNNSCVLRVSVTLEPSAKG